MSDKPSAALCLGLVIITLSIFILPAYSLDLDFILECSTWYESYLLTSKSDFIMVWGKGATDCYDMLDSWAEKLFLWHNDDLISDWDLIQAISYVKGFPVSQPDKPSIDSFEECVAAGNPVMESYPRQCRTSDGKHFVEVLETAGVFPEAMIYTTNAPIIEPEKGYFVDEIADGLYWVIGDRYQAMFLTTGEGVIVVDAPQPLGEKYLQAIQEVTNEPITHMIYSHSHQDHTGAAGQIFPTDIEYIAHQDAADILIAENDPNRPIPTITFDDTYTLQIGNQLLELYYIGPFHSEGDIVILAPRQNVMMAVDLLHPGGAPYRAFAITVDMDEHIKAHDSMVNDFDFDVLISGHMQILGTKDHIKTDKEFIFSVMDNIKHSMGTVSSDEVIQTCVDMTIEEWQGRLVDLEVYMADHCIAMQEYVLSQRIRSYS